MGTRDEDDNQAADDQEALSTPVDNVLRAPTDFHVSVKDGRSMQVSWKSGSTRDYGFAVERMKKMKIYGVDTAIWKEIAVVPARTIAADNKGLSHAFTDRSVQPNVTYCYRVRSAKGTVFSDYTDSQCLSLNG